MQKINLKKTTKEQMLNMLEKAWNANAGAADDIAALSKRIEEQNDALAKCVAEKNELRREHVNVETMTGQRNAAIAENKDLRTKLADTEAALGQATGEVINKANEIANLKADLDTLRNKLADTEAALGRANAECAFKQEALNVMRNRRYNAEQRADYAEAHPWRNLWAGFKREAARHE